MQREIKFRAWDKPMHIMVYFGLDDIRKGGWVPVPGDNGSLHITASPLMQYTGMDEFYQDDIVKDDMGSVGVIRLGGFKVAGRHRDWIVEGWYIRYKDGSDCPLEPFGLEIIGNIHQTPELINQGDQ